jgi:thiol-disulfide isomerase/thioredoxin
MPPAMPPAFLAYAECNPGEPNMNLRVAALFLLLGFCNTAVAKLEVGVVPPDFLGQTPDNDDIRISQFKGSVVVVTFWASWCGPCRRELPVLDVLQKAAGKRIHIIAVNVEDSVQDYRMIRRQLKDTALTFTHDRHGKISESYAVNSYPNLYVIDQNGVISAVHVGFGEGSLESIVDDINLLLAKPPTAVPAAAATGA